MMSTDLRADTTDPRVGTTFDQDGWIVRVDAQPDEFADSPADDGDWATPTQIAAYERGDWGYCLLGVKVSREGVQLGYAALGGIEYGYFTYTDEDDNVQGHGYVGPYTEVVDDSIAEAIEEAKETLGRLCAGVQS